LISPLANDNSPMLETKNTPPLFQRGNNLAKEGNRFLFGIQMILK